MADEIGPNLNAHVSMLDQIGLVVPVERARGTTPLTPPRGPRIGKDGVRLTSRSRRILNALVNGETDLDDPDFMRLRQLYQRGGEKEQAPPEVQGFPPELLALVQSYDYDVPMLPPPTMANRAGNFLDEVAARLRRVYYALTV